MVVGDLDPIDGELCAMALEFVHFELTAHHGPPGQKEARFRRIVSTASRLSRQMGGPREFENGLLRALEKLEAISARAKSAADAAARGQA